MITIAICDDDVEFLDVLEKILVAVFSQKCQCIDISKFDNGKALLDSIEKNNKFYKLIFLDVEMPVVNGFQVAERLKEISTDFYLLFTTYMEHQSRQGYLYGAYRYIFKNNLESEIEESVASLLVKCTPTENKLDTVTFRYRNANTFDDLTLKAEDILFLRRDKTRRVIVKTVTSEYVLLTKPLSEYFDLINRPDFYPIMRNYIVNFNHVRSLDEDSFILTGGVHIPLGIKREVKNMSKNKYFTFLQEQL